jgi:hypothetical protein
MLCKIISLSVARIHNTVPKASTWDIWSSSHVQEYLYNFMTYFYSENKFYLYKTIIDRGTQFFVAILTRYWLNMCIPAVHTLSQELLSAGDGTRKPNINPAFSLQPRCYCTACPHEEFQICAQHQVHQMSPSLLPESKLLQTRTGSQLSYLLAKMPSSFLNPCHLSYNPVHNKN